MNRSSFLLAVLAMVFLAASSKAFAQNAYPVVHDEPITVQLRDSRSGQAIPNLHLLLVAGYDSSDLKKQLWHEEVITDKEGNVSLPRSLRNLPWLQVFTGKALACKANPRKETFSVERMRNYGLAAPNRCGVVTSSEQPGNFTFYVNLPKSTQLSASNAVNLSTVPGNMIREK